MVFLLCLAGGSGGFCVILHSGEGRAQERKADCQMYGDFSVRGFGRAGHPPAGRESVDKSCLLVFCALHGCGCSAGNSLCAGDAAFWHSSLLPDSVDGREDPGYRAASAAGTVDSCSAVTVDAAYCFYTVAFSKGTAQAGQKAIALLPVCGFAGGVFGPGGFPSLCGGETLSDAGYGDTVLFCIGHDGGKSYFVQSATLAGETDYGIVLGRIIPDFGGIVDCMISPPCPRQKHHSRSLFCLPTPEGRRIPVERRSFGGDFQEGGLLPGRILSRHP